MTRPLKLAPRGHEKLKDDLTRFLSALDISELVPKLVQENVLPGPRQGDENMGRPKGSKTRFGRTPLLFKQTEVARAVKGAKHGGLEVARVKVTRTGDIVIETGKLLENDAGITGKPGSSEQESAANHPVGLP
jgi:hypothetical protein